MRIIDNWDFELYDGIWQFVGSVNEDIEDGIPDKIIRSGLVETGRDCEFSCKETWELIKKEFPFVDNYRDFCRAYREGKSEREKYLRREEVRYNRFWRK